MGEEENGEIRFSFDPSIRVEFCGAKVTTDGGLLLLRELDEALGLTDLATEKLSEKRTGMESGLKEREGDPLTSELDRAKKTIGELTMEVVSTAT